jgi:hypothetical protein
MKKTKEQELGMAMAALSEHCLLFARYVQPQFNEQERQQLEKAVRQWGSYEQAIELIRDYFSKVADPAQRGNEIGYARKLLNEALASGQVDYERNAQGKVYMVSLRDLAGWCQRRAPQQTAPQCKPPEPQAPADHRKQVKRDPIKQAVKELFPPDGEVDPRLSIPIVMKRISNHLKKQGLGDIPVTRDTVARVIGRRKT